MTEKTSGRAWLKKCEAGNAAYAKAMMDAGYAPVTQKAEEKVHECPIPRDAEKPDVAPKPRPSVCVFCAQRIEDAKPKQKRSMPQITREVARKYRITPGEMRGPRRQKSLVLARQEAWWHIKNECPYLSYPQIAQYFNRDHTSVLHGVRKHQERINGVDEK